MDEFLKHAFCSLGIAYLVVRIGKSATSLVVSIVNRYPPDHTDSANPGPQ